MNTNLTHSAFSPAQLEDFCEKIITNRVMDSVMLWGAPGIGKSSIIAQIASKFGYKFIDVRLSQLAPTDLRGLPVADHDTNSSRWYAPEFLPREKDMEGYKGIILFLDEFNMAAPVMQGIAQQLVLDRKVGSYEVPENVFIWAAGNRREDRASVFEMPAPLANRFIHIDVSVDFDSWKGYAFSKGISEHIIAFLAFRPGLLHKMDTNSPAWPSPRSWFAANNLMKAGIPVAPAIGMGASAEFEAFVAIYSQLPNLDDIAAGKGKDIPFPTEPSVKYAIITGLTARARNAACVSNSFNWLSVHAKAGMEWQQLFTSDAMNLMKKNGNAADIITLFRTNPNMQKFMRDYIGLVSA